MYEEHMKTVLLKWSICADKRKKVEMCNNRFAHSRSVFYCA